MEGPTPVSALIHAATMVTAGVFLMARMSPLMEYAPYALTFVTFIGASTAFFAATVGCVQNDIKRVIAYSTCSQLGYMFVAAGVGAYQVSIFHLITHAFFKALLFLSPVGDPRDVGRAGHAPDGRPGETDSGDLHGDVDRQPGAGRHSAVRRLLFQGCDHFGRVLAHTDIGNYAFVCTVLAAFLTAFYSWRLLFMTFHGEPRADHHTMEHVHELPAGHAGAVDRAGDRRGRSPAWR